MRRKAWVFLSFWGVFAALTPALEAGVSKQIQNEYELRYENKAMFLKLPVRGDRQNLYVSENGVAPPASAAASPLYFKVGEQVRITKVDFNDSSIRFKVSSIDLSREAEIVFRFSTSLQDQFPQRGAFDRALSETFTEGLTYKDIDRAKEQFVKEQFDQYVKQLANTSSTTPEFVLKAVASRNPEFQKMQKQVLSLERSRENLQQQVAEGKRALASRDAQLSKIQRELTQSEATAKSLRAQNDELSDQQNNLKTELQGLQQKNRQFESQVSALAGKLDVKTTSATNLGRQVQTLSSRIEELKNNRDSLAAQVQDLSGKLDQEQKRTAKLTGDLTQVRKERTKLAADLRDLTSNKDSLEARYQKTKREKENLQKASAVAKALRFEKRTESRETGMVLVSDVFLLSQKIGTLELPLPKHPGQTVPVQFTWDSPDLVKFSETERELYRDLGDNPKLQTGWTFESKDLNAVLSADEVLRTVAPRESVQWDWTLQGNIQRPERADLILHFIDVNGNHVELPPQEFVLTPGNLWAQVQSYLSWPSLLAGFLVGAAGMLLLRRGSSSSRSRNLKASRSHVTEKKL